jgi:acyl carrier protein
MSEEDVLRRTRVYITENFLYMRKNFVLEDGDLLLARRVIDSLGVMELVEFVEREFAVKLEPWEITEDNLGSVRAIARFVLAKHRDGSPAPEH